ncbi:MAG TPA: hypothetical protein VMM17_01800 [Gemmatimonadaceae bacterium]|nr:hypothetical protein [Gemmatimonadaceae bacterium]
MRKHVIEALAGGAWLICGLIASGCGGDAGGPLEPLEPIIPAIEDNPGTLLFTGSVRASGWPIIVAPHLTWSADGGELFFLQAPEEGFAVSGVPVSGGSVRHLYETDELLEPMYLQRPAGSHWLYFLLNNSTQRDVWQIDSRSMNGAELMVTPPFLSSGRLAVSSDERWFALGSWFPTQELHLLDTFAQTWRTLPLDHEPLSFSPDGSLLLTRSLWLISVADGLAQELAHGPSWGSVLRSNWLNDPVPHWTGNRLQFLLVESIPANGAPGARVSFFDAQTGDARQVATIGPLANWEPYCALGAPCPPPTGSTSPDGRKLALWVLRRDLSRGNDPRSWPHQIHLVDLETSAVRIVATASGELSGDITFSPNGQNLAYFIGRHLYLVTGL